MRGLISFLYPASSALRHTDDMDHQDAYEKREVDEVENKLGEGDAFVVDKKLTRSGLWKLDRRYVYAWRIMACLTVWTELCRP